MRDPEKKESTDDKKEVERDPDIPEGYAHGEECHDCCCYYGDECCIGDDE